MAKRRSRKSNNQTLIGVALIGIALLAIGGAGFWFMQKKLEARRIDQTTHCPTDHIDHITAVVIDLTDPISKTQSVALENALTTLKSAIPKYGKLDIYTITGATGADRDPAFSLCNPGSAADVSSELIGNRELASRIWQKEFGSKLDAVLQRALQVTPMEASPIFESIQFAAARSFGAELVRAAPEKRLVVVSDMLHHSAELSMYRQFVTHPEFRRTQYYTRIKPQLRGAAVDLYVLFRETRRNVQQKPWQDFWVAHFAEGDGRVDGWYPLQ